MRFTDYMKPWSTPDQSGWFHIAFGESQYRLSIQAGANGPFYWRYSHPVEFGLSPEEYDEYELAIIDTTKQELKNGLISPNEVTEFTSMPFVWGDTTAPYVPTKRVQDVFAWFVSTFGKPRVLRA